ncbi:hypothetical protein ACJX0J_022382, partial [Zea mays]
LLGDTIFRRANIEKERLFAQNIAVYYINTIELETCATNMRAVLKFSSAATSTATISSAFLNDVLFHSAATIS